MSRKQSSTFVTTRKGFCYLTVKVARSNFNIMRIRSYTITPQDKRDMRRLYPDYLFEWKKIGQQLAEKREVCRTYRSRRQAPRSTERASDRLVIVSYDPETRTFTHLTPSIHCHCLTLFCTLNKTPIPNRNATK